jgi:Phytanoyl-CoA dioxygenase (PhyH)
MVSSRLSWLLLPMHLVALATGAKSFRDNPLIGSARLNRVGLHVVRMRLAERSASRRRRRLAALLDSADRIAFARDGFVVKRDFLPAALFAELQRQALALPAPARHQQQGDAVTRRIALDRPTLARLPAVRALLADPRWLGLVRYIGSSRLEPIVYIQSIFARAVAAAADPQTRLHADTFHSSVKAWFFLTDVAADEGPLVYVPGSHRLTRRRLAWERRASIGARQSPDFQSSRGSLRVPLAALPRLGLGPPVAFAVPANTLVVADMMGFHARGASVRPSTRIEIWAYGRRNPFLPWLGLDPVAMPPIRGRAVAVYWRSMDLAERLGLAHNPWRPAGLLTASTPPDPALHAPP